MQEPVDFDNALPKTTDDWKQHLGDGGFAGARFAAWFAAGPPLIR
jgi:hypothetical protein